MEVGGQITHGGIECAAENGIDFSFLHLLASALPLSYYRLFRVLRET